MRRCYRDVWLWKELNGGIAWLFKDYQIDRLTGDIHLKIDSGLDIEIKNELAWLSFLHVS